MTSVPKKKKYKGMILVHDCIIMCIILISETNDKIITIPLAQNRLSHLLSPSYPSLILRLTALDLWYNQGVIQGGRGGISPPSSNFPPPFNHDWVSIAGYWNNSWPFLATFSGYFSHFLPLLQNPVWHPDNQSMWIVTALIQKLVS